MIGWLVSWGRAFVVFGALAMIIMGIVIGWSLGGMIDHAPINAVTLARIVGALIGFMCGSGIAGTIFGVVAAIFDIQESVRAIARARGADDDVSLIRAPRREPTFDGR